jgi:PAS domain S-box-containing protein
VYLEDRRLFTGIVHDLSARVQAEEALRHQAQLLELSYEPIFVWDLERGIVLWNQGCERLYGFPPVEALGRSSHALLQTVFPVPFETFTAALWRDGSWSGELQHTTRDGRQVLVESRFQVVTMDERQVVLEVVRDITAQKQAETALRDSEARLHAIVQTAVDGIITIDLRGTIESFNPAAEHLFGYRADAVIGQNIKMLMPSPYREEHDSYLLRYLRTGEPHIIGIGREVRGQRQDGTTFPMALAVSEMHPDGRRMFTGIVHDLTARVQAEESVRRARDELELRVRERTAELEAANEEIRRFAYIVSHDLRAPLVNLQGFASELRTATHVLQDVLPAVLPHLEAPAHADVAQALDQDIPEALDFIETSVTRMDHLIRAILHLSRLGHRELTFESLDMGALVHGTVQTLAHQIAQRQVQVTVEPLPTVSADRTAMEQIMGNLLANAVAYLAPGRPGEIVITGERHPGVTVFAVRDNGRGIATDDTPKVFEPFRRVGRQDVPGEGMGLAYVRMLVRRHGGEIQCHSTLEVGTTFTFTIAHQISGGEVHAR